jgi:sugar phosphate isomerase/epimerase
MKNILICDDTKPSEIVDLCRKNKYGIEVQAFYHPDAYTNPDLLQETENLISDIKLRSLHGPFGDLCPRSFDSEVRNLARKRFNQAWRVAKRLDVSHVVFHHGRVPNAGPLKGYVRRSKDFWLAFLNEHPDNLTIHLENMLESGPEVLCDLIDTINDPLIDANLDIGHAHCNSNTEVIKWVEGLGKRIGYVHLHDNHGDQDEHLGLSQGNIQIKEVCYALEQHTPNAIWAIEAEGKGILQTLDWLYKHGFLKNRIKQ